MKANKKNTNNLTKKSLFNIQRYWDAIKNIEMKLMNKYVYVWYKKKLGWDGESGEKIKIIRGKKKANQCWQFLERSHRTRNLNIIIIMAVVMRKNIIFYRYDEEEISK